MSVRSRLLSATHVVDAARINKCSVTVISCSISRGPAQAEGEACPRFLSCPELWVETQYLQRK
jgi:hypothetical protein